MILTLGAIVLVVATVVIIAIPLVDNDIDDNKPIDIDLTADKLQEEKDNAYLAIKEAEFDYETGKLSEEDLKIVKKQCSAKAIEVMKKLEEHQAQPAPGNPKNTKDNCCPNCGNQIRADAKFCSFCGAKKSKITSRTCSECGHTYKKGEKFCAKCGNKVS